MMATETTEGLFYKLFLVLAAIASITALVGIFYLLGVVLFSRMGENKVQLSQTSNETKVVWVSKRISKCSETWHHKGITFDKYVKSLGVEVLEKSVVEDDFATKVACSDCECPSGEVVFVKVYNYALDDLVGFVRSGPPSEK